MLSAPARAGVLPGASCFIVCSCQLCPGRSPPARPPPTSPAHSEQGALEGRADPHPLLPELVHPPPQTQPRRSPNKYTQSAGAPRWSTEPTLSLAFLPGATITAPEARGGGRRLSAEGSGCRADPGQGAGVQAVPHHSQVLSAQQSRHLLLPALGATGFRALAPLLVTGQHSAVYT